MSFEDKDDEITEKIKIIATDDAKIKSFGELLTNDSSRAILQLLFNEELTALQISEKTGISLQLVKYHIIKLQDLGVVKVTKVEKNSKSQDMKFYSASKFSMVIVPPKYSEKTKESKLLVRSFRHIYKITGLGISAGISGLMSLFLLQQESRIQVPDNISQRTIPPDGQGIEEGFQTGMQESGSDEMAAKMVQAPEPSSEPAPEPQPEAPLEDSYNIGQTNIDVGDSTMAINHDNSFFDVGDLAIILIAVACILGGLAAFFFFKSIKQSKQKQII
jgi:DNA-binding transcriptional ArsR family regulator